MKTFERIAAQGDFLIIKVDEIPKDAVPETGDGPIVIAHSETGHNHVMERPHVKAYRPVDPDIFHLFLAVEAPTPIKHLRSFDTHEPIMVPPGNYEIRRQREHTPEGFRRAAD